MRFSAETTTGGVTERLFTIGDAPGAVWAPAGAEEPRPLVLLGHGGGGRATPTPGAASWPPGSPSRSGGPPSTR